MSKLIYFELNDWFKGRDYPNEEPFIGWIKNNNFSNDDWCRQNELVVLFGFIDMSRNWCITATEDWVKKNCPKLLTNEVSKYIIITHSSDKETGKPCSWETTYEKA